MFVVSIGEVLWDVFEDRTFLGGAPLNVCANLQRCGHDAYLVSGVGDDIRGEATIKAMQELSLPTSFIEVLPEVATGTAIVSKDARGEPCFTIERPAAFDAFTFTSASMQEILKLSPAWIYMGTLLQTAPRMEHLVQSIRAELPQSRCFYDMNLREGHWNLPLVERLCEGVSILKLNELEAATLASLTASPSEEFNLGSFCRTWAERFGITVICVTLGPNGCCVFADDAFNHFSGQSVEVSDTVGAGDAFAAAFLHGYHKGWPIESCARFANALGGLVASRPGATPAWSMSELGDLSPN